MLGYIHGKIPTLRPPLELTKRPPFEKASLGCPRVILKDHFRTAQRWSFKGEILDVEN